MKDDEAILQDSSVAISYLIGESGYIYFNLPIFHL